MECGQTSGDAGSAFAQNQCLYLSLAAAVARPPATIQENAGALRAGIEEAVRTARPDWAEADFLGQEVGASADFLIWGEPAVTALRGRAVAVYDSRVGTCEIFHSLTRATGDAQVIALWFTGAHYQWVSWADPAPLLADLLSLHAEEQNGAPLVPTLVTNTAG